MKQAENVGRKIPEFKLPDIYPASFNPAICCTPNRHLRKTKQKGTRGI